MANGENDMDKNEVLKILETAKDENGEVPMRLVRQAFEKLPEPCGDTIYRQAAIDAMCDACSDWCDEGVCSKVSAIQKLPPAQQWIPCSERLPDHPENDDYYLVTIQCEHYDGWDDYVTGFAEWTKRGWDEVSCYIGQIKVVAWMPLPEPYKEGREV